VRYTKPGERDCVGEKRDFIEIFKKQVLQPWEKKKNTYKDQTWRTCLDLTGFWKKKKVKLRANKLGQTVIQ